MADFLNCPSCGRAAYDIDTGCALCSFVADETQEQEFIEKKQIEIPILSTAGKALSFVFLGSGIWSLLTFQSVLAVLIYIEVEGVILSLLDVSNSPVAITLSGIFRIAFLAPMIVSIHRRILLRETMTGWYWKVPMTKEYALIAIAFYAPIQVIKAILNHIASIFHLDLNVALLFVSLAYAVFFWKVFVIFPYSALGYRRGIRDCWKQTTGNGYRIVGVAIILGSAVAIFNMIGKEISSALQNLTTSSGVSINAFFLDFLTAFQICVWAAVFSAGMSMMAKVLGIGQPQLPS